MTGDLSTMSSARAAIVQRLQQRPWFQATSPELQAALLGLPDNPEQRNTWNGFLEDLANRPDRIGGVLVMRLVQLLVANFACIPVFEVLNEANGNLYTYEYVSWKHGPMSGSKGLVLVRTGGRITHFIVLRGEKFAPAMFVSDSVGGFSDLGADGINNLPERVVLEIREELGASDLVVEDIHDLGRIQIDAGMTNNRPGVFCAVLDAGQAAKVGSMPVNPDWRELRAAANVAPIEGLPLAVREIEDPFLLIAVVRAIAAGILPPEVLAPTA